MLILIFFLSPCLDVKGAHLLPLSLLKEKHHRRDFTGNKAIGQVFQALVNVSATTGSINNLLAN